MSRNTPLDPDGQPAPWFNSTRRIERDLSEMLGLAKGVLFDGAVTDEEARRLLDWTEDHADIISAWPGRVLHQRLRSIFSDGRVTEEERSDLAELLQLLGGHDAGMVGGITTSTELPLDDPPPLVEIPDRVFVLTGRFAYGPRRVCEESLRAIGGWPEPNVTLHTDYVVIGTFASRDWIQTPFGRKIEKAVEYREQHGRPAIIAEDHWAASF